MEEEEELCTEEHCIVTKLNINYYLMFSEALSLATQLSAF